jgi:hypothetical protein
VAAMAGGQWRPVLMWPLPSWGLYYAGRGVISKILCRDPLLVEVKIIEVSPAIEVEIPFPVGDLRRISQCAGREVI